MLYCPEMSSSRSMISSSNLSSPNLRAQTKCRGVLCQSVTKITVSPLPTVSILPGTDLSTNNSICILGCWTLIRSHWTMFSAFSDFPTLLLQTVMWLGAVTVVASLLGTHLCFVWLWWWRKVGWVYKEMPLYPRYNINDRAKKKKTKPISPKYSLVNQWA